MLIQSRDNWFYESPQYNSIDGIIDYTESVIVVPGKKKGARQKMEALILKVGVECKLKKGVSGGFDYIFESRYEPGILASIEITAPIPTPTTYSQKCKEPSGHNIRLWHYEFATADLRGYLDNQWNSLLLEILLGSFNRPTVKRRLRKQLCIDVANQRICAS